MSVLAAVLDAMRRRREANGGHVVTTVRLPTLLYREIAQDMDVRRTLGPYDSLPSTIYLGSICFQDAMDGT